VPASSLQDSASGIASLDFPGLLRVSVDTRRDYRVLPCPSGHHDQRVARVQQVGNGRVSQSVEREPLNPGLMGQLPKPRGYRRGLSGQPSSRVNTKPVSCHTGPAASRSSACCFRRSRRIASVPASKFTVRLERSVLGSLRVHSPSALFRTSVAATVTVPASKSTSCDDYREAGHWLGTGSRFPDGFDD
jgi:hypothetical protein